MWAGFVVDIELCQAESAVATVSKTKELKRRCGGTSREDGNVGFGSRLPRERLSFSNSTPQTWNSLSMSTTE